MSAEKFLLVDDNTLLRASLAKLIGLWRKDAIIEEASNGHEALEKARRLRPGIILMDIRMPGCGGIEATRLIKAELPETKVIMLTVSEQEEDLFEAISSGAHGYLLKNVRPEELFEMLEGALRGEAVIAPAMAQRILQAFVSQAHRRATLSGTQAELSPREMEVLRLLAEGLPNKLIARRLGISEHTVKFHINAVMGKLGAQSRTEVVILATRLGLILL